ncbi:MAG: TetR/AcrR family transcriptional regulator [Anaerolineales bacterium]|nr:TetR/AcrR family transcriptional regulator [Anaerolineales bacterium]
MPDPLPSLRERKKAATKERIYFEALGLFRRRGFSKTTIEDIAEAAGVSKGTFFNYFPTKEALLQHLSERQAQATAAQLQIVLLQPESTTRQRLERLLLALTATVEADRELTRVAVFEFLKAPAALAANPYRNLFRQAVGALLAEGQRRGEVAHDLDRDLLSSAVTGVYFQQIFEWCAAPAPYSLSARLGQLLDILWRGVER